jgi:carbonic anhydrase/acetyltransferase-like protein (isoleucine patch superfamily)
MLIRHRGSDPAVDPSAFIAPTAVLVGRVAVGARSRVLYGAVLDSEGSRIEIGECTIVSENTVIRAMESEGSEYPVILGDHVLVGPHATLLGCTVEPYSYIATGATVLQGAVIRSGCVVGVGAVVHAETVLRPGSFLPPNTIAIGDPADVYSPDEKVTLASAIKTIRFGNVAFGADPAEDRLSMIRKGTEFRSREYESHFGDTESERKAG